MNWFKHLAGIALATTLSGTVGATDPIIFDTNGTDVGGQITVGSFDWTPGSALAVGSVPLAISPNITTFDFYTQASLGNFVDTANNPILGTGLNSAFEITFVAGFGEVGTSSINLLPFPDLGGITANFGLDPNATVNFFQVYYDTSINSNALAGTGYNDGTLILSGLVISNQTTFFIPFTIDSDGDGLFDTPDAAVPLDGFGNDDYLGTGSLSGSGGGTLNTDVTFQDFDYFISNITGLLLDLTSNTSTILNFNQTDPSAIVAGQSVSLGGAACQGFSGAGGLGGNNGDLGCGATAQSDFLFQADANTAFFTTPIPEPSALALVGLGLGLLGFLGSMKRKA